MGDSLLEGLGEAQVLAGAVLIEEAEGVAVEVSGAVTDLGAAPSQMTDFLQALDQNGVKGMSSLQCPLVAKLAFRGLLIF